MGRVERDAGVSAFQAEHRASAKARGEHEHLGLWLRSGRKWLRENVGWEGWWPQGHR